MASRGNTLIAAIVLCVAGIGIAARGSFAATPGDSAVAIPDAKTAVSPSGVKQLIFEEQKIEGKIRRPQLVLIKADQRPEFTPMIMQSLGKAKNIASLVDATLLEAAHYRGAFKFEGTKIVHIEP